MKKNIKIKIDGTALEGILSLPEGASSIVLFAHGSGSSRFSPRNSFVADVLNNSKIGTLLLDLLTEEEDSVYKTRFDIGLLAKRLENVYQWLRRQPETKDMLIGLFGASTGAAAALEMAADLGENIAAIVSRGGRPDLAIGKLGSIVSPTLLIVGGDDTEVIELNKLAYEALNCPKEMEIIEGASHLFEEPGTLEQVAELALAWFRKYENPNK